MIHIQALVIQTSLSTNSTPNRHILIKHILSFLKNGLRCWDGGNLELLVFPPQPDDHYPRHGNAFTGNYKSQFSLPTHNKHYLSVVSGDLLVPSRHKSLVMEGVCGPRFLTFNSC